MRTNVIIDDSLLEEAFILTKIKTKKELLKTALEELIENRKRKDIREIRGKINFYEDYDYKEMRR
jgi:Arc/MetJ family transcription regulator